MKPCDESSSERHKIGVAPIAEGALSYRGHLSGLLPSGKSAGACERDPSITDIRADIADGTGSANQRHRARITLRANIPNAWKVARYSATLDDGMPGLVRGW
jgi:hypothetical protein